MESFLSSEATRFKSEINSALLIIFFIRLFLFNDAFNNAFDHEPLRP